MGKPAAFLLYGGIGLTSFGVAYDNGYFGATDNHNHSIVFAPLAATSSASSDAIFVVVNNTTGEEIVAPSPSLSGRSNRPNFAS